MGTERTAYGKKEAEMWTKDVFKDSGFCLVELRWQDNCFQWQYTLKNTVHCTVSKSLSHSKCEVYVDIL